MSLDDIDVIVIYGDVADVQSILMAMQENEGTNF